jgi:6-phosphofructo-2-kinase/fructose-2,6-biphosphatase 2
MQCRGNFSPVQNERRLTLSCLLACGFRSRIGYRCASFSVGSYRRRAIGAAAPASFFDPQNASGMAKRAELARQALGDLFEFLGNGGGQAAIYDGTNATLERRKLVTSYIAEQEKALDITVQLVWIEMVCTDPNQVSENIREAKLTSPDSQGLNHAQAAQHFIDRIAQYEQVYQPLGSVESENDQSYIVNIDCGRRVIHNKIEGYLMSKIAFFVCNLKVNRSPIYITRHGESLHNVKGLIGGDPYLSPNGIQYAQALSQFIASEKHITREELEELSVWTSTLKRTLQTAEALKGLHLPTTNWRALIEIQVGPLCDNLTYEQIAERYPDEAAARKKDKLHYRYPQGGESYTDVIARIEPCILELERMSTPILLIVHRAVARCLYSYFLDLPAEEIPRTYQNDPSRYESSVRAWYTHRLHICPSLLSVSRSGYSFAHCLEVVPQGLWLPSDPLPPGC